jgi:hypothetical protein
VGLTVAAKRRVVAEAPLQTHWLRQKSAQKCLKKQANTLFDMALMQDKIYNLDQKSAKQAILDLTFEKDRLKILGEYDVKATKVDSTANKSAELKALQNKRNVELVERMHLDNLKNKVRRSSPRATV